MEFSEGKAITTQIARWRKEITEPITLTVIAAKNLQRHDVEKQKQILTQHLEHVRGLSNLAWASQPPEKLVHARKMLVLWLFSWEQSLLALQALISSEGPHDLTNLARWQTEIDHYSQDYESDVEALTMAVAAG
jgi:hypothetical protein